MYCSNLYSDSKYSRSAKRFSSNVSWSESSCQKYSFAQRQEISEYRNYSLNRNKGNSGRRRTTRSAGNIAAVRALLQQNPRDVSARRNPVGISSSVWITSLDLQWHPYRMHVRHALLANDLPRRLRYSEWFIQHCQDQNVLANFIIGDEAAFTMNGEVNSRNVREYAPKGHPSEINFDRNYSRANLTVWA